LRKFLLLGVGVVLSVGTLAACVGGPPPPPPTDPHDVLVVGDSVSFALGCVLGGPGAEHTTQECPPRSGYSTQSEYIGACTISQGTLLFYNRWTLSGGNPCWDYASLWSNQADRFRPKVVIINTAGWEIVDRWSPDAVPPGCEATDNAFGCPPPNNRWGGPNGSAPVESAKAWYTSQLFNAIQIFADKPWHPTVIVSNGLYSAGPAPVPDDPGDSPIAHHAFWEPYQSSAPQAGGQAEPASQPDTFPYTWNAPNAFTSPAYRSNKAKIDQFNAAIQFTKQYVADNRPDINSRVQVFDLWSHFAPGGNFNEQVCPPPNDFNTTPQFTLDLSTPNLTDMAWKCQLGAVPAASDPTAIQAREPGEDLHITAGGYFQILRPYLEPVVCQLLGQGAPNQNGCT
jgi:hypothetical protein